MFKGITDDFHLVQSQGEIFCFNQGNFLLYRQSEKYADSILLQGTHRNFVGDMGGVRGFWLGGQATLHSYHTPSHTR